MKKYGPTLITIILGVAFLISGNCALRPSTTTKFYILSPLASPAVEKQDEKKKGANEPGSLECFGIIAEYRRYKILCAIAEKV